MLQVCFYGGVGFINNAIATYANEWTNYANIRFVFGDVTGLFDCNNSAINATSHIKVGFLCRSDWSLLGRESIDNEILGNAPGCAKRNQSMNLVVSPSEKFSDQQFRQIVLHEFGHALGLKHEHQNPATGGCDDEFDWPAIEAYLKKSQNMTVEQIRRNFKPPENSTNVTASPFDKSSIMLYPMPPFFFKKGRQSPCWISDANLEISDSDKKGIGLLYPSITPAALKDKLDGLDKAIQKRQARDKQIWSSVFVGLDMNDSQGRIAKAEAEQTKTDADMVRIDKAIKRNLTGLNELQVVLPRTRLPF